MPNSFFHGALFMADIAIALFFCSFWLRTRDKLFLFFTAAFSVLAVSRILIVVYQLRPELSPWVYSVRLLGYGLIIAGIIGKNRAK